MAPSIYVGILNWNGSAMTLRCVDHVLRQTSSGVKVTVIDNGSRPDEVAVLRSGLPADCELVQLPQNKGFAGGMNVALGQASREGYELAWLLNNDAFAASDCLEKLVTEFDTHPSLAILTPRLVGIDGAEQHAGGQVRWTCGEHHLLDADKLTGPPTWGSWLTGTACLVRLEALRRVGFFDPRFFAYWEDADLCLRVFRAGGDFRAVPQATCVHVGTASTGGRASPFFLHMQIRNTWLFYRKHLPVRYRPAAFIGLFAHALEQSALRRVRGEEAASDALVGGLADGILGQSGPPRSLRGCGVLPRLLRALPWRFFQLARALAEQAGLRQLRVWETQRAQPFQTHDGFRISE